MTGGDGYEEWLDEFVSARDETGYPLTRRRYYERHFGADTDPRAIYTEARRALELLRGRGAISG